MAAYKKLCSQSVLDSLTRLISCLDLYNHTSFMADVCLYKDQYLSGSRSLSSLRVCVTPIVMTMISELAFDMRQCYLVDNMSGAKQFALSIKKISMLL